MKSQNQTMHSKIVIIGGMIPDGWAWTIPLRNGVLSVGLVEPSGKYKAVSHDLNQYLDARILEIPFFRRVIKGTPRRITPTRGLPNVGYQSEQVHGAGWVLAGDAAFFVDPCYSSGVHFAAISAEMIADAILDGGKDRLSNPDFSGYQQRMKMHQMMVSRLVDSFYMATNSTVLKKMIPRVFSAPWLHTYLARKFAEVTSGRFDENRLLIDTHYYFSRFMAKLFPIRGGARREGVSPRSSQCCNRVSTTVAKQSRRQEQC